MVLNGWKAKKRKTASNIAQHIEELQHFSLINLNWNNVGNEAVDRMNWNTLTSLASDVGRTKY